MNETRTNPKVGWVKADQARGRDDLEREQNLIEEIAKQQKLIKKLERRARDRMLPISGISVDQLAQGSDTHNLSVLFQDNLKKNVIRDVALTWDDTFKVIAACMYGYIVRRVDPGFGGSPRQYPFEPSLIAFFRMKIVSECGNRQLNLLSHQIDAILIQFKQLGLLALSEQTKDEDGKDFRGYSLTEAGEEYLTRLTVAPKRSAMSGAA